MSGAGLRIGPTQDVAAAQAIRLAVFVREQGVSLADELDGQDGSCAHWLASDAEGPVATLRIRREGEVAVIGRVAVLPRARGTGLGAALMRAAMAALAAEGAARAELGAQLAAIAFYERLGFVAHGPIYDDAGLPHRHMARDL